MTFILPADVADQIAAGELSKAQAARNLGVARKTLSDAYERQALQGPVDAGPAVGGPTEQDEILVIERFYTEESKHLVYPLGDVHVGSPEHNAVKWQKWLGYLEGTPESSLLFTGDGLNCAIQGSKSDIYLEKAPLGVARKQLTDDLRPLAREDRIDVMIPGNHENRVWRATGDDPIDVIAGELGVPYAPALVVVVYYVGEQRYTFLLRHGTGGSGTSAGSVANALRNSAAVLPEADVVVAGHTHKQVVAVEDRFRMNHDEVPATTERFKQYHVSSGSFVGYARYAAERGWAPTHVGAPRIFLDGERHDIHVSI